MEAIMPAPPPWLERLLSTDFFSVCRSHGAASRSECNLFCVDCDCSAFCFYCRASKHKDHQVIQIRRSSYHDVVRVSEIQKILDTSGVQTYVINSAKVLFLNERPQPKGGKAVSHFCQICGRNLLEPFRFCSLGCKLADTKKSDGDENPSRRLKISSSSSSSRVEDESADGARKDEMYRITSPSGSRRRKGIPHRAPFRS